MLAPPGSFRASDDRLWPRPPPSAPAASVSRRRGRSYGLRFSLGFLGDGRTMLLLVPVFQGIGEAAAGTGNSLIPSFVRHNYSFSFIHPFDPGEWEAILKTSRQSGGVLYRLHSFTSYRLLQYFPRDSRHPAGFCFPSPLRACTSRSSARAHARWCVCLFNNNRV